MYGLIPYTRIFEVLDTNGNGTLNYQEIQVRGERYRMKYQEIRGGERSDEITGDTRERDRMKYQEIQAK